MKGSNKLICSVAIIGVLAVFLLCIYFWNFREGTLSINPSDWGSFGGYISPILTLLTMSIMIYTIYDVKFTENNKKTNDKFERLYLELLKSNKLYNNWDTALHGNSDKKDNLINELETTLLRINLLIRVHFNNQVGGIIYPYYHLIDYLLLKNKALSLKGHGLINKFFLDILKKIDIIYDLNNLTNSKNTNAYDDERKKGYNFIKEKFGIDLNNSH